MTDARDIPVLVVFGATASGKTSLADTLFSQSSSPGPGEDFSFFKGRAEIVSADSMQVYRGMDIGTAKPSRSLLERLPHHLIDIRDPREQFSAGDFVRLADELCRSISGRGRLPVILGGTGFYIRNFLCGLPSTPESDPILRKNLQDRAEIEGTAAMHRELSAVDPESAAKIHPNDEYRILRALEVFLQSGKPRSAHDLSSRLRPGYRFKVIFLDRPRAQLYDRINLRVAEMFEQGLPEEFARLLEAGHDKAEPGMQAIGYREFFLTDPPGADPSRIREEIARNSRKYAKRQEVFMSSIPGVERWNPEDLPSIYNAVLDAFRDSVHTS